MNFYIVFTKNRKKFDKYVKENKIKNKLVLDIRQQMEEYNLVDDYEQYKDYFNLIMFTKITQTHLKKRDVYYIPDFEHNDFDIQTLLSIKTLLIEHVKFNILLFYDEFENDQKVQDVLFSNMDIFDASQILKKLLIIFNIY